MKTTDFRCPRFNGKKIIATPFERAESNLKFSKTDLDNFGKSNILPI